MRKASVFDSGLVISEEEDGALRFYSSQPGCGSVTVPADAVGRLFKLEHPGHGVTCSQTWECPETGRTVKVSREPHLIVVVVSGFEFAVGSEEAVDLRKTVLGAYDYSSAYVFEDALKTGVEAAEAALAAEEVACA